MIVNPSAVVKETPGADHRTKEGYFVVISGSTVVVCTSATTRPYGLILEGENTDGVDAIALPNFAGIVKVKSTGVIAKGAYLQLVNDGSVVTDSGAGARVIVGMTLESAVSGDLIDAVLMHPVTYA